MEKEAVVNRISEVVASLPAMQVAYLYGSFLSRDDFRDTDSALFLDDTLSPDQQASAGEDVGIAIEEALSFCHECDVRILNRPPVWFQFEVIGTGRPVYARTDAERFDRETAVLIEYLDMRYTFDLFDAEYPARA